MQKAPTNDCYHGEWDDPWLKVPLPLRMTLTYPWHVNVWREVRQHRQHIPWLLAEQARLRKAGWFN